MFLRRPLPQWQLRRRLEDWLRRDGGHAVAALTGFLGQSLAVHRICLLLFARGTVAGIGQVVRRARLQGFDDAALAARR